MTEKPGDSALISGIRLRCTQFVQSKGSCERADDVVGYCCPHVIRPITVMPMKTLNRSACLVALVISAGEIARFWGSERFIPMAFDELLVAAALLCAAWRSGRDGAVWHLAAWGALCGLMLVLLVEIADH